MTITERPPRERITEILANRQQTARLIRGYQTRRDFLQLCAEIDHLRIQERIDVPPFDAPELSS